jgi:predicted DNA-binding transcriptional regulator AlpA
MSVHPYGEADMNRRLTGRAATQPRRGLDRDEAAIFVGVTLATFDQMVSDGRLPKSSEFDGELVWDLVQLDRAMDRLMGLRRSTL